MDKKLKLFFSYGHDKNGTIVERLKNDLEKRGHEVWIDTREIKPLTTSWRRKIQEGVMNAANVIAFLSKHSTREESVCKDELRIAVCVKGATIKTVLLEPEKKVRMPVTVSDIQWLDMSDWKKKSKMGEEVFEQWYKSKFNILCEAIESDESFKFNGEIQTLKEKLKPFINSDKEYRLLERVLHGRKWLEERIEYWQDHTRSKTLVIYGKPGSGKSAFCANYAHFYSDVYVCLFCEWNKEYSINPNRLIRTISFRLASKMHDYRERLLSMLDTRDLVLDDMKPEALFEFLLSFPLNNLINGNRENALVVVDGLDEAEVDGDNPVAKVFSECVKQMPSWIKFVFTSRHEQSVKKYFTSCDSVDIVEDMPDEKDMLSYLNESLENEMRDVPNKYEVYKRICELSEGVFLYAVLLVEDVKAGIINLQDIHSIPRGLYGFYMSSMNRKFKDKSFEEIRPFLELLCVSETIPEDFVLEICNLERYGLKKILAKFGSWIVCHKEEGNYTLGLSHKSVSDWFCDYDLNEDYYIDCQKGALLLANYCRKNIERQEISDRALKWGKYMRSHVANYYIIAKAFDDLEDFLISRKHDLTPYWIVWNQFPDYWNHDKLIQVFWDSPLRNTFLNQLQHEGNTNLLLWIFEKINDKIGIKNIDRNLFSIYMDIVHLSGNCPKAVEITNQYLHDYTIGQILQDDFLSNLYVRKLHHSLFFKPMQEMLNEAMAVFNQVSEQYSLAYNEIVFGIGGNIYVMLGEWEEAIKWLKKSEDYAQKHGHDVFHKRDMRKLGDCYCHEANYEEAERLILDGLGHETKIRSRYDVYLMGALANLYTCTGQIDEALKCYDDILKYSVVKGILSWVAHSQLGIANIHLRQSNLCESTEFAKRAKAIYDSMDWEWGRIMCDSLIIACEYRNKLPLKDAFSNPLERARKLQLGSCIESIEDLCNNKCNYLKLYFI